MAKRKSKSKGGKQASTSKLANKRLTKLAKQGKLKKKVKKYRSVIQQSTLGVKYEQNSLNYRQPGHHGNREEGEEPVDNSVDVDDLDYFGSGNQDVSFLENVDGSKERFDRYKRKRLAPNLEENYEVIPRKRLGHDSAEMKALLPIKNRKGIVPQMIEKSKLDIPKDDVVEQEKLVNGHKEEDGELGDQEVEPLPELTTAELFAQRQEKLMLAKEQIAALSSAIIENPEESTRKLKELRLMLEEKDPIIFLTVRKLVMISLMEVFKDILPGYRIRLATDKEMEQQVKKETKKLREFEQSLLTNYKYYLEFLELMVKGAAKKSGQKNSKKRGKFHNLPPTPPRAQPALFLLAIRCLCTMLTEHPHFNYATNIVSLIVPYMQHKDSNVSDTVCHSAKKVFKEDKTGEITLDIVKATGKFIKSRNFNIKPKVLDIFLSLKIKEVDTGEDKTGDSEKKKPMMRKERMKIFSRRERKRQKKMKELEKEMEEAAITESKQNMLRLNSEIIQTVFLTYFRILKNATRSALLSSVLEGLSKFAHLINLDFFHDLFTVLNDLIDGQELTFRESLHCVQTAFTILSGQGSALNIDPQRFYRHLYSNLFKLANGDLNDDVPIVLRCLDVMINKRRKQVSHQRVLAYIKRLSTVSLLLDPHSTLAVLAACRGFIHHNARTDLLYDTESQGSGIYLPELDEPEHCNAHNTALYEYHMLRHHYHPITAQYAGHMCVKVPSQGAGQLSVELARRSPTDLFNDYCCSDMTFKPSIPLPKTRKQGSKACNFTELHSEFDRYITPVKHFLGET